MLRNENGLVAAETIIEQAREKFNETPDSVHITSDIWAGTACFKVDDDGTRHYDATGEIMAVIVIKMDNDKVIGDGML